MAKSEMQKMAEAPMENDDGSVTEISIEIARTMPDGSWSSETYIISGAGKLSIHRSKKVKT